MMIVNIFEKFDLGKTLDCGQCFRWEFNETCWQGVVFGDKVSVTTKNNKLIIEGANENDVDFWENYFDLKIKYSYINSQLSKLHPVAAKFCETGVGIRILRQDPWEVLCSFIISQNNNIPRIKKIIKKFCEIFGKKRKDYFMFPSPKIISGLTQKDLEPIKAGFRSAYLIDAAKKVDNLDIDLEKINELNLNEMRNIFKTVKGVGPKIAECVLLYGFHKFEAFPSDVWIKKSMEKFFPGKTSEFFGKYAGVAQQYLYYWARTQGMNLFKI
ncbi:MAG: DNA-3-methyladenine glycosylase 2 family protein [Oscillospiraceae bacterium]|jgi:N-glycosylase/DNA lyase|nr:DNA-3-methyladenine glycosylase 2 family protein [Oscillospiraceae bacterium]